MNYVKYAVRLSVVGVCSAVMMNTYSKTCDCNKVCRDGSETYCAWWCGSERKCNSDNHVDVMNIGANTLSTVKDEGIIKENEQYLLGQLAGVECKEVSAEGNTSNRAYLEGRNSGAVLQLSELEKKDYCKYLAKKATNAKGLR